MTEQSIRLTKFLAGVDALKAHGNHTDTSLAKRLALPVLQLRRIRRLSQIPEDVYILLLADILELTSYEVEERESPHQTEIDINWAIAAHLNVLREELLNVTLLRPSPTANQPRGSNGPPAHQASRKITLKIP